MASCKRGNGLVLVIVYLITAKVSAECDLGKIFRTPKNRANVNFDHFEILERASFEEHLTPSSTTTTTEAPSIKSSKSKSGNVANAQILLRIGSEDCRGSPHIMKIPPQRPVPSDFHPGTVLNHNFFYNPLAHKMSPPYHSQYYHPYPPPVPFAFPNYYYCNYGGESQFLPLQVSEYLRRHPNVMVGRTYLRDNSYYRRRPAIIAQSPESIEDFIEMKGSPLKNPDILTQGNSVNIPKVIRVIQSRSQESAADQSNQKENPTKEGPTEEKKIDAVANERNPDPSTESDEDKTFNDLDAFSKEKGNKQESVEVLSKKEFSKPVPPVEDISKLLAKALVEYKCENCSQLSKMLISYPITGKDEENSENSKPLIISPNECPFCNISKSSKFGSDVDKLQSFGIGAVNETCQCKFCQCCKKKNNTLPGRRFSSDIDELVGFIVAEIDDSRESSPSYSRPQVLPPIVPIPKLPLPLETIPNLDFDGSCSSYFSPSSRNIVKMLCPKFSTSYGDLIISEPKYALPSLPRTRNIPEELIPLPKFIEINSRKDEIKPAVPVIKQVIINADMSIAPVREQQPSVPYSKFMVKNLEDSLPESGADYFFQEPNVFFKKIRKTEGDAKYFKIIPRRDLELVDMGEDEYLIDPRSRGLPEWAPERPVMVKYCQKCGSRHNGGNFCKNCGHQIKYLENSWCPSCPRESRQLNDW